MLDRRFLSLALLLLGSCYHVSIKSSQAPAGQSEDETELHFLWGLTGASVSAPECRDGFSRVELKHPWWSWGCLIPVTGGLVAATSVEYTCAQPSVSYAPAYAPATALPAPRAPDPSALGAGKWHILLDGKESGPWGMDDLRRGAEAGWLKADTLVWQEGSADWVKASVLSELNFRAQN